MRASHPSEQVIQQPAPALSAPTVPPAAPPTLRPHTNGNYTAPGAPRIVIREESAPILRRVDQPVPTPPADTEASQEAPPPVKAKPAKEPSDATPPDSAAPSDTTPLPAAHPTTTPRRPKTTASHPPRLPPRPTRTSSMSASPPTPNPARKAVQGQGKAQFRVQTGSYTDESNARSIADQLRGQGYTASTHSEREGDHLVYKVQAGAYRSKSGANKAAGDLQKKGFPAYVAPIAP